jgi:L-threonylcarbamoyladenylate synthase
LSRLSQEAAKALIDGELVALPTETVYGLGADASNRQAVGKIFTVKGRPSDHPLIIHVADAVHCSAWVNWETDDRVTHRAQTLAAAFWPGPLTLIMPRRADAPNYAMGSQKTVGIRVPSHPVAQELLRAFHLLGGLGIAAPSANRFGKVSPTSAAHVKADLGSDVKLILDGGDCEVGLESTIVDLTCTPPRVLRPGVITTLEISQCLDEPIVEGAVTESEVIGGLAVSPQVSGSLAAHYAPQTPLKLLPANQLVDAVVQWVIGSEVVEPFGVWASKKLCEQLVEMALPSLKLQILPDDPVKAAHSLYATLRAIDKWNVKLVFVEQPRMTPNQQGDWAAVNDRLTRASYGSLFQRSA